MSVDFRRPFSSPPLKRARETISLFPNDVSKCGELFVTSKADKWTFLCGYCEEFTSDIGVFICHIRLEHLNVRTDLAQDQQIPENYVSTTIASTSPSDTNLTGFMSNIPNPEEQPPQSVIVKEEENIATDQEYFQTISSNVSKIVDIASLTQPESCDMENLLDNKNFIATTHYTSAQNIDVFTITPIRSKVQTQELSWKTDRKEIVKLYNVKNEAADKTEYENDKDDDVNTISCYSPSEGDANDDDSNDTVFKVNNSNKSRGRIKPKIKSGKKSPTSSADNKSPGHKCPYCHLLYQNKKSIKEHTRLNHNDILPFRCKECNIGFNSKSGLKHHQNYHNENKTLRCPICAIEHTENQFTTHVLTHESDTCFPCQVCGKVHASSEERKKHWKTHAKEKPFPCRICYRRFDSRTFLAHHKKSHIQQYRCNFCEAEFDITETQAPPYICPGCKNSNTKEKTDDRRLSSTEQMESSNESKNYAKRYRQKLKSDPHRLEISRERAKERASRYRKKLLESNHNNIKKVKEQNRKRQQRFRLQKKIKNMKEISDQKPISTPDERKA